MNNNKQDLLKFLRNKKLKFFELVTKANLNKSITLMKELVNDESNNDQLVIINTQAKESNMNTNNKEQGFNNTQIKQLVEIVRTVVSEVVPPMVRTIIKEEVPPMIDQALEPIKNRLDIIEQAIDPMKQDIELIKQDIKQIKNCPTIKKELGI